MKKWKLRYKVPDNKLKVEVKENNISNEIQILKVITLDKIPYANLPFYHYCLLIDELSINTSPLIDQNWGMVIANKKISMSHSKGILELEEENKNKLNDGDIIRIWKNKIDILYKNSSNSNLFFITEKCNHNCIMCSQPPKNENDEWRLEECRKIIELLDDDMRVMGISGGEPTLVDESLLILLKLCKEKLPNTILHLLTNGKRISNKPFLEKIVDANNNIYWGVPIYGCTPAMHDYVVQSQGSFNDTINALYNLKLLKQPIELRIVLIKEVLNIIDEISEFILRNLPFVDVIAFMGIEPTGYARMNYKEVIPSKKDYEKLDNSILELYHSGLNPRLYNIPLCYINKNLWTFSDKSISDWKNIYMEDCYLCSKKSECCGFFSSHYGKYIDTSVYPF